MEKEKKKQNYKAIFVVGIIFIGSGIAVSSATKTVAGIGMMGIGIIFMFIGLKNRDKW